MKIESKEFIDLSIYELYSILKLRQEVFIVEQKCNYLDCDDFDLNAIHVSARKDLNLIGYLRVIKPNIISENAVLGRILVNIKNRKNSIGKKIILHSIKLIEDEFPNTNIEMSAQSYLIKYYKKFGFETYGNEYLEDNIPHIKMIKKI
ncbi:MAG: hypothetical protein CBC73_05530 [Flavobacteriales bacterium TMED113]|nr:MAG: hypothetical protein CBC73_05530 [Flavobacteriales bacterium TMED113]